MDIQVNTLQCPYDVVGCSLVFLMLVFPLRINKCYEEISYGVDKVSFQREHLELCLERILCE